MMTFGKLSQETIFRAVLGLFLAQARQGGA
jgi:hypothetical protein